MRSVFLRQALNFANDCRAAAAAGKLRTDVACPQFGLLKDQRSHTGRVPAQINDELNFTFCISSQILQC